MTHRNSTALKPSPTSDLTPFELSRVYAKGWRAGMDSTIDAEPAIIDARAAALNPYQVEAERARWTQGFEAAVQSRFGHPGRRSAGTGAAPARKKPA